MKRREKPRPPTSHEPGEIAGLPESLAADNVVALFDQSSKLAIADGERLTVFRLELKDRSSRAAVLSRHALPGIACGMAATALGLMIASERSGQTTLQVIKDRELLTILELPGKVTSLGSAGIHAYAVLVGQEGQQGRLVQIHLRQRSMTAEKKLDHANFKISVDPVGQQVVLIDPAKQKVLALGSNLQPRLAAPAPTTGYVETQGEIKRHPYGCGCMVCRPEREAPRDPADRPVDESGAEPAPREPQERPPQGPDYPGEHGVPSTGGGVVIGRGDRVDHYPPPGRSSHPCGLLLFYKIADLLRIGTYFLASDAQGRRVSLLSADMNLVDEWQFGRGGARLVTDPGTTTMLMHIRGSGQWIWRDVYESAVRLRPDLDIYPVIPLESKTFIGQKTYALSHGQQPSPKEIKAILLPVIEGNQKYTSANLNGFGAYMKRTMLPVIRDYYDENSFGKLENVNISIFGVDYGPTGGPLTLPRPQLADYYFPKYDPARVELVKNGVNASSEIIFDGRESLTIEAKPLTGGPGGGKMTFPFFALAFQRDNDLYPFQIKFLGTETLTLNVVLPDGTPRTLNLAFPSKTIDILDDAAVAGKLNELDTYLDNVMHAAETAAGIASRLFATPKAVRIPQIGKQFGRLLVTFKAANLSGNRLKITGTSSTHPGGDPMGLSSPFLGTMSAGAVNSLTRYLENAALLAQEAAGFGYNNRLLANPGCAFDAASSRLTTSIPISDRFGGPGAEVKYVTAAGLAGLFDSTTAKANSATTANNAEALRDRVDLYRDVFSAAIERLRQAKLSTDALKDFGCVLIMPVEPSAPNPADPEAVLPAEVWNVTPLHQPFGFRGAEDITTIIDRKNKEIQLQSAWALIFMANGKPDNSLICHEVGHAIRFGDLYYQTGYRDELGYMTTWAMMDDHRTFAHHCGYHKLQAGWIDDGDGSEQNYGRVFPIGLPVPDETRSWELLLVSLELWRDSLVNSARAAFGVGEKVPVVQLAYIDFGGDGATFGLIEARQPGLKFSKSLPGNGGVLITNAISWNLDDRFATNTWYRRSLHLLNPANILRNAGDSFDLAFAPELPVKGMKVQVVEKKIVEGDAQVYRIKVTRENADFVDLYFDNPQIYYKNPDLWVDWAGNNKPSPETLTPDYSIGQPTDQGEAIRVHPSRPELHWIVARLRNRGKVKAQDVKLNFFYFEPPGGGDGGEPMETKNLSHYKLIGTITWPEVVGGNVPIKIPVKWDVPPGFNGHTCLLVQIEDYKIPEDSAGAALGSDDVWQVNNHAQKNVDKFEALSGSPFAPIEFDFSVHNAGVSPEMAYLEPDGLPYGMKLTVTPPQQLIHAGDTARFSCVLELDEKVIRTGCENDQRFQIYAWRRDPESTARWGGVEYEIRPREKTSTKLEGGWGSNNQITLRGTIAPDPGGGIVRIRLDFPKYQAFWVEVSAQPGGKFTWTGQPMGDGTKLQAVAWFEGNRKFGSSRSNLLDLFPPPIIR